MYRDYGDIVFDIKKVMDEKAITINQIVKKTGLHHQVVRRYYEGTITRYDKDVLFLIKLDLSLILLNLYLILNMKQNI